MTTDCTAVNSVGIAYEEFSCLYPTLGKTYLSFETTTDPMPTLAWMQTHNWIPIVVCCIYAFLCYQGQVWMKPRQRFAGCKPYLIAWNLLLSAFSFVGMLRTAPNLIHNLSTRSLEENFCEDPRITYGSGSTGLWVQLFILSKFPELIDTLFIVINKKPLIFLHWYHHITVLLYCWHSYVTTSPPGIFFVVMNYSVHATMYLYYALVALRMRPKWLPPIMVTSFQISQMVIGIGVTLLGFYYSSKSGNKTGTCRITSENNTAALVMYGSYLVLFTQFFIERYYYSAAQKKQKQKKSSAAGAGATAASKKKKAA